MLNANPIRGKKLQTRIVENLKMLYHTVGGVVFKINQCRNLDLPIDGTSIRC